MGGDEYRCMGNLISRTFVDLQCGGFVAVAKLLSVLYVCKLRSHTQVYTSPSGIAPQ